MSRPRPLLVAAATDPGRERTNNEDRVLCEPELGIFAVIDGVGGESAGEVAAEAALDVLRARLSRRTTDAARLVREAIALANRQIYERSRADARLAGMSCVLTVAVLDGMKATVGHVGDSRLYSLTPGGIRKVTPDHSPVGAQEDAGRLSESEAMHHPRRNEIFRDVGSSPHEPDDASWIDVLEVPLEAEGALLLCSDGLSDMVSSRDILETVEKHAGSPRAAVRALIERANAAGGKDNVSAVLVEGERFAEAVRRRRTAASSGTRPGRGSSDSPAAVPRRVAGAAWARQSAGERMQESLGTGALGKALKALLLLVALAALIGVMVLAADLGGYREPLWRWVRGLAGGRRPAAAAANLVVGIGDGGLASIGEALARARPGETIEVAPGRYRERIVLRDGVAVVSRARLGAVLLAPPGGGSSAGEPAVLARGIQGARLSGFRVVGEARDPWRVGVVLDGSTTVLEDVEVTGAAGAGIDIHGADRSTVRYCHVHHNGGPGVAIAGSAAPRLLSNLIAGNGGRPGAPGASGSSAAPAAPSVPAPPAAPAGGVEVRDSAMPLLADNRIEGNRGPGVSLVSAERSEEIFRWNSFGGLPRDQAVRLAGASSPPGGPAGSAGTVRRPGNAGLLGGASRVPALPPRRRP